MAKNKEGDSAASDSAMTRNQGTQTPGGPVPGAQAPGGDQNAPASTQPMVDDRPAHPIDPTQLQTPSNSAQLPRPDLTQGGAQQGSPLSDSPAGTPPTQNPGGMQVPGGSLPSDGPTGAGAASAEERKGSIETILHGKPGLENVFVTFGNDGCATLTGTVTSEAKKEEAAAIARGVGNAACIVNKVTVKK
jgi:hypothetical protein